MCRTGGVFSHTVGMAVHDVGSYRGGPLEPGQVFSVDPQLWVREENLYLRFEDTVVVTASGVENFTDFIPMELDDMEKLVLEKGVVQKTPPVPASAIRKDPPGRGLRQLDNAPPFRAPQPDASSVSGRLITCSSSRVC